MTPVQRINAALSRVPGWWLYLLAPILPAYYLWLGMTGGLGVEPIKAFEHLLGERALQLLILTLAITPLRQWTGISLMKQRRAFGVITFFYVLCHLLVWLVLDVGILSEIWADIVKRPYITIGMAAFTLLIPLAITSNNFSVRKLGPKRWRAIHKLAYAATFLGALHFAMLAKGFQIEPLVYLGLVLLLLAARFRVPRRAATV